MGLIIRLFIECVIKKRKRILKGKHSEVILIINCEENQADFIENILWGHFALGVAKIIHLFLNFFPFKKTLLHKIYYVLVWSIFSIIFEWFTLKTGFFYYNEWKIWYSGLLYPLIFLSLVLNMKFVKRINQ